MKNFVFISPNFPLIFSHFVKSLREHNFNVLGIGDTPYCEINEELKNYITEYYYLPNLSNYEDLFKAVAFFSFKYGHIDELESNNEYWLEYDARLRKDFNINGLKSDEILKIKRKDLMKKYYDEALVKNARYTLVNSIDDCYKFIEEVNYPVFVKPVIGVGASDSYKLNNEEDLISFINNKDDELYIMEEYINGTIYSFDGIADKDSNVVCYASHVFTDSNAELVNNDLDSFYYMDFNPEEELIEKGKRTIKAFGVKKRCFHLEFFKLNEDKEGLGKKGDYVALEVNMRSGGGNVPELFKIGTGIDIYDIYASVMNEEEIKIEKKDQYYAIEVTRQKKLNYVYEDDLIREMFKDNLYKIGKYDPIIAKGMGGEYFYIAKFLTLEEAFKFKNIILMKRD